MALEKQTDLENAISLYVNRKRLGLTVRQVCKQTGIPLHKLYSGLRELGLAIKPTKRVDKEKLNQAVELYLEKDKLGLIVEDIVNKTGVSASVIYSELRDRGYKLKTCGRKFEQEDLEEAISLFMQKKELKLSGEEISRRTRVPRQTIYWHLNRRGLK
ncbi:transcriptional regulator [Bacillus toyonensis]|uniref:transcriptional regulator n=1 Tax=Bacillus toyonensis TaxID=155322 RepID=UPI000BFA8F82|nr:transcriptional regulator [Bacillus toyonensis]PGF05188.1 transcriptional regulator [Bacillus toyonensis]